MPINVKSIAKRVGRDAKSLSQVKFGQNKQNNIYEDLLAAAKRNCKCQSVLEQCTAHKPQTLISFN